MTFLIFFLVLALISLGKNKTIQALVKFYVFLTKTFECKNYSPRDMGDGRKSSKNNYKTKEKQKIPRRTCKTLFVRPRRTCKTVFFAPVEPAKLYFFAPGQKPRKKTNQTTGQNFG